jgi:hypothetical protein
MDPGPSGPDAPIQPVPGIDFLRNAYNLRKNDSSKMKELAVLLRSSFPTAVSALPLRLNQKIKLQTYADIFANQVESGNEFETLFERFSPDEKVFFRKMLGSQIKQLPEASPEDMGDADPEEDLLNKTVNPSDPAGGRKRTRKHRRKSRKTRKHRRKQIRK